MKRLFDIIFSFCGLLVFSPVLLVCMFLIWRQDNHSPFYVAPRVSKGGGEFKMVKLRSMIVNADNSGVDSTSADDNRITAIGSFVRKYKIDELTQLWNVFIGDMSLVGPRPNVRREVDLYTSEEMKLISVRPGITDISSIVFSDEGDILEGSNDPDLTYNQLIRPWKSRLGILYVENMAVLLDIKILFLTVVAIVDKQKSLNLVDKVLANIGANETLRKICQRKATLKPARPPGSTEIVQSR